MFLRGLTARGAARLWATSGQGRLRVGAASSTGHQAMLPSSAQKLAFASCVGRKNGHARMRGGHSWAATGVGAELPGSRFSLASDRWHQRPCQPQPPATPAAALPCSNRIPFAIIDSSLVERRVVHEQCPAVTTFNINEPFFHQEANLECAAARSVCAKPSTYLAISRMAAGVTPDCMPSCPRADSSEGSLPNSPAGKLVAASSSPCSSTFLQAQVSGAVRTMCAVAHALGPWLHRCSGTVVCIVARSTRVPPGVKEVARGSQLPRRNGNEG